MRSRADALAQGRATGRYLRGLDIGIDLAPVLDVPSSPSSFIASRTFSSDPAVVAARGTAFGQGLVQGGVASTAKHFPGLGRLYGNTDLRPGRVPASRIALRARPRCRSARRSAPGRPRSWSARPPTRRTARCRRPPRRRSSRGCSASTLGFRGVTLSDDLATKGVSPWFDAGRGDRPRRARGDRHGLRGGRRRQRRHDRGRAGLRRAAEARRAPARSAGRHCRRRTPGSRR